MWCARAGKWRSNAERTAELPARGAMVPVEVRTRMPSAWPAWLCSSPANGGSVWLVAACCTLALLHIDRLSVCA